MELAITLTEDGENPVVGDLRLSAGRLVWTSDLALEVAQRIAVRLQFFKGEWWLDRRQGLPWYEQVLVKSPDLPVVRGIFSKVITETPGLATLESLILGEPDADRLGELAFSGRLTNGQRFTSAVFGRPYLVRVP